VTLRADGLVDMHGRSSGMINSGGEKVFAEEVERALQGHPAVRDVLVVGRPSQRWGNEVVAVIELIADADDASLDAHTRSILAPYKVPRAYIRVHQVKRGPAGKADYRWARDLATSADAST
jgi:3-oxocholest-4-en-26-oate---CoA ligase